MLKNFWYACEFSAAVTDQPQQIKMFNRRFVLYRDATGKAVVLNDQCPHRGAALSLGRMDKGCIRCPYHGWKFEADGKCSHIPSNAPGAPIPYRARVTSYPVQEKYGFVWMFYGDLPPQECPPIPHLPEFDDPTFHAISLDVTFKAHYTRLIENALDPAHMGTVHSQSFGAGFSQDLKVAKYEVEKQPWSVSAKVKYENFTQPKGFLKLFFRPSRTEVNAKATFHLPNITVIETDFGRGKLVNYAIHLPVDEMTTVSKRFQFRNVLTHRWADQLFVKLHRKVCEEDRLVSESQYPKVIPGNLAEEVHVAADALQIAYRKLRQKCIAMGWDLETKQDQGRNCNDKNSRFVQPLSSFLN